MEIQAGAVVVVSFPGVTGVKRRPAVVLSSPEYHEIRPDLVIGLLTTQTTNPPGPTDHALQDWRQAGLRKPTVFRSFFATLPQAVQPVVIGYLSTRDWQAVRVSARRALAVCD